MNRGSTGRGAGKHVVKAFAWAPLEALDEERLADAVRRLGAGAGGPVTVRAAAFRLRPTEATLTAPASAADGFGAGRDPARWGLVAVWADAVGPLPQELPDRCVRVGWDDPLPVVEYVQYDARREAAVTRLGFVRRRPGMSHEEFARHWITVHGPLVLARRPLFERYTANLPTGSRGVDGIVEQDFRDEGTWAEHDRLTREEKPEVLADIRSFVGGMDQFAARRTATVEVTVLPTEAENGTH